MNNEQVLKRAIKTNLDTFENKQTCHLLHLVLTLVTGLWVIVWIVLWMSNRGQQDQAMKNIRDIVEENQESDNGI